MKHFLRFVALSGSGWLFDCALLLVLTHFSLPLSVANAVSAMTAALAVFVVARLLVFQPRRGGVWRGLGFYCAYQLVGIFAASLLIGTASTWMHQLASSAGYLLAPHCLSLLAKVIVTPPQLVANFLISRFLIEYAKPPTARA